MLFLFDDFLGVYSEEPKKWFGKMIYEDKKLKDKDSHRYYYKKFFFGFCYEERYNLTLLEAINEKIFF